MGANDTETPPFQIHREMRGAYLLLRLTGRYVPALLDELHESGAESARYVAVDMSVLERVGFPLLRYLHDQRARCEAAGGRLLFLRLPDRLRPFLEMLSRGATIPVVAEGSLLEGAAEEVEARLAEQALHREEVRLHLSKRPLWRYLDRDGCWLCPFCATIRRDIRIASWRHVPEVTLELISHHLRKRCANYAARPDDPWPGAVLERLLQKGTPTGAPGKDSPQVQELKQHLEVARERQQRLLPTEPPAIPGTEIAIIYRPAEQISGDFYDFVPLSGGRVAVVIGDVAGHGIEAAILMGVAKKVIQVRLRETQEPRKALALANGDLFQDLDRKCFVSALISVLDPVALSLVTVRAGHNPPLLYNPRRDPTSFWLEPRGQVMGIQSDASYEQILEVQETPLRPGDTLLFRTDGADEAVNAAGEEFGPVRVRRVVEENGEQDANMILAALAVEVENFTGGRGVGDDLTAICLKVKENGGTKRP